MKILFSLGLTGVFIYVMYFVTPMVLYTIPEIITEEPEIGLFLGVAVGSCTAGITLSYLFALISLWGDE